MRLGDGRDDGWRRELRFGRVWCGRVPAAAAPVTEEQGRYVIVPGDIALAAAAAIGHAVNQWEEVEKFCNFATGMPDDAGTADLTGLVAVMALLPWASGSSGRRGASVRPGAAGLRRGGLFAR